MKNIDSKYLTFELTIVYEEFMLDKTVSGLSARTIEYYKDELTPFIQDCNEQGAINVTDITPSIIRSHLLVLSMKRNPGGLHARYRAIRSFLNWAWDDYEIEDRNPISKVKAPKINAEPLQGVSIEDVLALIATCEENHEHRNNRRDYAILLVLLDTALRASEFLALNWEDVDLATGTITVLHGKGDKQRKVRIGKRASKALRIWRRHAPHTEHIWATIHGNRLSINGLTEILKRRSKYANIKPPSIHDFRRASLLAMLRNGADIVTVSRYAGHSDIRVTLRYLKQNFEDLKIAHSKTSPVDHSL